jgi:glyoxylate reductase
MTNPSTRPRACITIPLDAATTARLAAVCEPIFVPASDRSAVLAALADAEGLMGSALFPIDTELFDRAPRLRVVSNFGVGYNNVDPAEATRRGVAVCNTPGVLTAAVADLTIGLILAASRGIPGSSAYVASGGWTRGEPGPALGFDLAGKTLGLVGYGRIGRATAERARAFGMSVVFNDVITTSPDGTPYRTLDALLAESDIVSIHTNLTPESRRLIGAAQLARVKRTAWIVNTARGPIIDEAALAEALATGRIAGAALDVMEVEPPPAGSPILSAPNTILLPHVGSGTVETRAAMLDLCLRNFMAVLACERPPECVNPEALERALVRRT